MRQELVAAQLAEVLTEQAGTASLRILDVGCGQGTQALRLARAGHRVTGLDISEDLLEQFATGLRAESAEVRGRVQLVLGAGEEAPSLTEGSFDLVLCQGVLMYLDDIAPMLSALSAVARERAMMSLLVRNMVLDAEREAGRRDPYRSVAALLHLVYAKS